MINTSAWDERHFSNDSTVFNRTELTKQFIHSAAGPVSLMCMGADLARLRNSPSKCAQIE